MTHHFDSPIDELKLARLVAAGNAMQQEIEKADSIIRDLEDRFTALELKIEIPPGIHIYSHPETDDPECRLTNNWMLGYDFFGETRRILVKRQLFALKENGVMEERGGSVSLLMCAPCIIRVKAISHLNALIDALHHKVNSALCDLRVQE